MPKIEVGEVEARVLERAALGGVPDGLLEVHLVVALAVVLVLVDRRGEDDDDDKRAIAASISRGA